MGLEFPFRRLRELLVGLRPASVTRARWRRPEEPVEPRVRRLVAERLAIDARDLAREVSLTDDLAADSLDLVELAIGLEEELGISVPESTIDRLRTYGELVDCAEAGARARRAHEARVESERTPTLIWARILPPPSGRSRPVERSGWLTPYTAETIVDSALSAGAGARLDMHVPPNLDGPALARLRAEFSWLRQRRIAVHIRRDPRLPPLGAAA